MTIRCELYDGGTKFIKVEHESPPGMDLAYWRELDMEYDFKTVDTRAGQIRSSIINNDTRVDLRPWPEKFPGVMWMDYSQRHYGVIGGPKINLWHHDLYGAGDDNPVPDQLAQIIDEADQEPAVNRGDERVSDLLDMEEIQAGYPSPTEWIRLPTKNETGACQLRTPAVMMQRAQTGAAFVPEGDYNPLYLPFDLRKPEYYRMADENGQIMSHDKAQNYMRLMNDGYYRLYLMPAKWRWVATVVVYYLYVSWFEMFFTRQIFSNAWFNRPPIYPIRHDVLKTRTEGSHWYNHALYSHDNGINDGFDRSRGSATLRFWIIDAQWWTMSEAYIYYQNDPVTLVLWQHPPDPGDVVLGIGRVDYPGGEEEKVWLIQDQDVSVRWPNTVIGQYLVPFLVTV